MIRLLIIAAFFRLISHCNFTADHRDGLINIVVLVAARAATVTVCNFTGGRVFICAVLHEILSKIIIRLFVLRVNNMTDGHTHQIKVPHETQLVKLG